MFALEFLSKCVLYSSSCSWKNLYHFKDLSRSVWAESHSEVKWRPLDNIETRPSSADISHPSALIVLLSPAVQIYDTQLPCLQLPPHNRGYYLTIAAINWLVLLFISCQLFFPSDMSSTHSRIPLNGRKLQPLERKKPPNITGKSKSRQLSRSNAFLLWAAARGFPDLSVTSIAKFNGAINPCFTWQISVGRSHDALWHFTRG